MRQNEYFFGPQKLLDLRQEFGIEKSIDKVDLGFLISSSAEKQKKFILEDFKGENIDPIFEVSDFSSFIVPNGGNAEFKDVAEGLFAKQYSLGPQLTELTALLVTNT